LYPNTTEQEESSDVTKNVTVIVSPEVKRIGMSAVVEMSDADDPSKRRSGIGGMGLVGRS
jgi:hypothetical protein